MQAKLEPSELSYLLHAMEVDKVVGVNNRQIFPSDPATRDALLSVGLAKLQEHGWFVRREDGIDANNHVMLMAAVMADPAYTLCATHYVTEDVRQTLTYYANNGIIVEQFLAPDSDYVLSQLDTAAEIVEHLREAFAAIAPGEEWQMHLTFDIPVFEHALAQTRAGDLGAFEKAIIRQDVVAAQRETVAHALGHLRPVGRIEGAAILGQSLRAWGEIGIMQDGNEVGWLARKDDETNTIELWPMGEFQFHKLLVWLLELITPGAGR